MPADASLVAGILEDDCLAEVRLGAAQPVDELVDGQPAVAPREALPRAGGQQEALPRAGGRPEDEPRAGARPEDVKLAVAQAGYRLPAVASVCPDGQRAGPDVLPALWQRGGLGGQRGGLGGRRAVTDAAEPSLPSDAFSAGHENLRPGRRRALRPDRCALSGGRHFPQARRRSLPLKGE
jgi:hypothetical protein